MPKVPFDIKEILKQNYLKILYILLIFLPLIIYLNTPHGVSTPEIEKSRNLNYQYEARNLNYSAYLGKRDGDRTSVQLKRERNSVTFELNDYKYEEIQSDKSNFTYKNSIEKIDVKYSPLPNGMKEEIILKVPNSRNEFTFNLKLDGLKIKKDQDNNETLVLVDKNNKYQFHFEQPYATDSKGIKTYDVKLKAKDNKLTLTVNPKWLKDKKRAYPVYIDPTIVHDTSSEFLPGIYNRSKDSTTQYIELTSDANTVALWNMNEASGNILDSSGNSHTGTVFGTTVTTGISGNSRYFNGSTDYISITNSSDFDFGSGDFTFEWWEYRTDTTNGKMVFARDARGGGNCAYLFGHQNYVYISSPAGCWDIASGKTLGPTVLNSWQHIAITRSGNTFTTYRNGEVQDTWTSSLALANGNANPTIGAWNYSNPSSTYNFSGMLDDIRIHKGRALTQSEIKEAAMGPRIESSFQELNTDSHTVGLWHLNETSGSTVYDLSGLGNNGTASGTTVLDGHFSKARNFNGTSDYINLGSNDSLNITGDLTIEAWVYINSFTGEPAIATWANGSYTTYPFHFRFTTTGALLFNDQTVSVTSNGTVTANTWTHVAVRVVNNNLTFFINGVPDSIGILNINARQKGNTYLTLSRATTGQYFSGKMDEIRISNVGRSDVEILSAATRRPYSTYTSDILDFTSAVSTWNSFAWTEWGVMTGDAETPKNSTGLIAQWNFNNTSGTTATNDSGSCSTACNTTLTNFTSTSSQDQSPISGWTSIYKRWGAGALNFAKSATNYLTCTDANCGGTSRLDIGSRSWSISTWVNTRDNIPRQSLVAKGTSSGQFSYQLEIDSGIPRFYLYNTSNSALMSSSGKRPVNDGVWHQIVGTYDGLKISIYVDGVLEASSTLKTGTQVTDSTGDFFIGARTDDPTQYFDGVIDTVSIYERALTGDEILSNYQSSNVEFQTRSGSDATPNDGGWDTWKPVTSETQLLSLDSDHSNWNFDANTTYAPISKATDTITKIEGTGSLKINTGSLVSDVNTVGLWHLDETSGTGGYLKDSSSNTNHGTPTGTTISSGKSGKSRTFASSSDYISISDHTSLDLGNSQTIDFWFKQTSLPGGWARLVGKGNSQRPYGIWIDSSGNILYQIFDGTTWCNFWDNGGSGNDMNVTADKKWHHLAGTYNGTTGTVYLDGKIVHQSNCALTTPNTTDPVTIGYAPALSVAFIGSIDEVRISNTTRNHEFIAETFRNSAGHRLNRTISSTNLSSISNLPIWVASDRPGSFLEARLGEDNYSVYEPDANTMGLWNFEEVAGTTGYLKDSSAYANNATPYVLPTGGTITTSGGYRIHTFTSGGTFTTTAPMNVEVLVVGGGGGGGGALGGTANAGGGGGGGGVVYNSSVALSGTSYTVTVGNGGAGGAGYSPIRTNGSNGQSSSFGGITASGGGGGGAGDGSAGNNGANGGGGGSEYGGGGTGTAGYNGGQATSCGGCNAGGGGGAGGAGVSGDSGSTGGIGYLSSISGSSVRYAGGGGGGSWYSVPAPGVGGAGGGGNGNYGEQVGYSGTANTGGGGGGGGGHAGGSGGSGIVIVRYQLPITTNTASGLEGRGQLLPIGALNHFVRAPQSASLNVYGTNSAVTIEAWIQPSSMAPTWQNIIYKGNSNVQDCSEAACSDRQYTMWLHSSGYVYLNSASVSSVGSGTYGLSSTAGEITAGKWYHVAGVIDSVAGTMKLYINGKQSGATAAYSTSGLRNAAGDLHIGSAPDWAPFKGLIDEVRISNTARTADQIRQAFEFGSRKQQITIDFGAKLDSGNLITNSGDTSFTVDATYYGLSSKGSKLYPGETVIVRENYDGTVYTAQGVVNTINESTGAVTISSWDAGSTFPSPGFSQYADVFKWQQVYLPVSNKTINDHVNGITKLSLRITDETEGRNIWLDNLKTSGGYLTNPTGSTVTSQTGNRYFQYRAILTSNDNKTSSSFTQVTTTATTNVAPEVPTQLTPTNNSTAVLVPTSFTFSTTDSSGDYLRYKVEICENLQMNLNCQTADQTSSQSGWSGQNTQTSTAYTSGSTATYTTSNLSYGHRYFWRVYAIDPAGSNSWSASQTPISFTTNAITRSSVEESLTIFSGKRETEFPSTTNGWTSITGTNDSKTTASTNGWIDSSNLTPGRRYLILASGTHSTDSTSGKSGLRVSHGGTSFTESESVDITNTTNASNKTSYFWFTVWTAVANEDLEMEIYWNNIGTQSRAEDITMMAIDAEDLITSNNLKYALNSTNTSLTSTLANTETLTFTPATANNTWWIMGYNKTNLTTGVGAKVENVLNLASTTYANNLISVDSSSINPILPLGMVQSLTNSTQTFSLQAREYTIDQSVTASGIFALNITALEDRIATYATNGITPDDSWINQFTLNPLNSLNNSEWLVVSGASTRGAVGRLVENVTSITDDSGGWLRTSGDKAPLILFDYYQNLSSGIKTLKFDTYRILIPGTGLIEYPWMVAFSTEINPYTNMQLPVDNDQSEPVRPQLKMTSVDPDGENIQYKLDICTNEAMTTGCNTYDQTVSQGGWSGQNAVANTQYTSGTQATYTPQSDLTLGQTYYWRAYAKDPSGTNTWSAQNTNPNQFTISSGPSVAQTLWVEGSSQPTGVQDVTPEFSAIFSDPYGEGATAYEIEVNTQADFAGTVMWDTNKQSITIANNARSADISYAGSALDLTGTKYYWRIRFWNDSDVVGSWASSDFTMYITPVASSCYLVKNPASTQLEIKWKDNSTIEDGYRVQRKTNGGAWLNLTIKPQNATSHTDSTISVNNTYQYRVAPTLSTSNGGWCTTDIASVMIGSVKFEGLNLGGIQIR